MSNRYKSKYFTIAHELLRNEEHVDGGGSEAIFDIGYETIDRLIDKVLPATKFPERYEPINADVIRADALSVLGHIENVLIELDFVVVIKTEMLKDTFTAKTFTELEAMSGKFIAPTGMRAQKYYTNPSKPMFRIDCDISSFLYLAVADVANLPISMVEVPGHNFVRWHLDSNSNINWDTNHAASFSDNDYRDGGPLYAGNRAFTREEERRLRFLSDMNRTEVIAYHQLLVANAAKNMGKYAEAEAAMNRAIAGRPYAPGPKNNLAWFYLTNKQVASPQNNKTALKLAIQVDKIDPDNKQYKDTLSCAYAANGLFDLAIETERDAYNKPERLAAFKVGKSCLDIGEK